MSKKITIAICTYNRAGRLNNALESLAIQSAQPYEFGVLVVDNNSYDNTKEVTNKYVGVLPITHIFEQKQGLSHARNRAILECKTDFIIFIDDDAKVNKEYVKTALDIIKEKQPMIFGGPIYPFYEGEKVRWFKDQYEIRRPTDRAGILEDAYLSGSNIIFRKDLFDAIGLFSTDLGMKGKRMGFAEETEKQMLAKEQGIELYYDPRLVVHHFVSTENMNLWNILRRKMKNTRDFGSISTKTQRNIVVAFAYFGFGFLKACGLACMLPFRSRKEYPFWQNYVVEKIVPNIHTHFFGYFK